MITVTNPTKDNLVCGAIEFKPGENPFKDNELSDAKLAQISSHPRLKWAKTPEQESGKLDTKARAK